MNADPVNDKPVNEEPVNNEPANEEPVIQKSEDKQENEEQQVNEVQAENEKKPEDEEMSAQVWDEPASKDLLNQSERVSMKDSQYISKRSALPGFNRISMSQTQNQKEAQDHKKSCQGKRDHQEGKAANEKSQISIPAFR